MASSIPYRRVARSTDLLAMDKVNTDNS
ncbi:unnamed protein product, partial [Allacma fusca]